MGALQAHIRRASGIFTRRNDIDNMIMPQDIFNLMGGNGQSSNFVDVKVDIERAYGHMRWDYLQAVLIKFGFLNLWIKWIMGCITSISFTIMVN